MRSDPFAINLLLDAYESLLTKKQQDVMNLHYKEDLSLAEISEELSISRAGVLDHIKRATASLYDYEERLHLVKRSAALQAAVRQLRPYVEEAGLSYINKLEDLLS